MKRRRALFPTALYGAAYGAYPHAGYGYGAGYGAYGYAAASPYYYGGGYASPYSYGYRAFGKTTFPCISPAKMFEKDDCSARWSPGNNYQASYA